MAIKDGKLAFWVLTAKGNHYTILEDWIDEDFDVEKVLKREDISINGENYSFFNEEKISNRFVKVYYVPEKGLWRSDCR